MLDKGPSLPKLKSRTVFIWTFLLLFSIIWENLLKFWSRFPMFSTKPKCCCRPVCVFSAENCSFAVSFNGYQCTSFGSQLQMLQIQSWEEVTIFDWNLVANSMPTYFSAVSSPSQNSLFVLLQRVTQKIQLLWALHKWGKSLSACQCSINKLSFSHAHILNVVDH